jgi:hypothetical protein
MRNAITEPAAAIAAAKCIISRRGPSEIHRELRQLGFEPQSQHHPRPCNWCVYPVDRLVVWLNAWNGRAGFHHYQKLVARDVDRETGEVLSEQTSFVDMTTLRTDGSVVSGRYDDAAAQLFFERPLAEQRAAIKRAQYGDEDAS